MQTLFICVITLLAAAPIDPFYGEIGQKIPTFEIEMPDGEKIYGAFRSDDEWITSERQLEDYQGPINIFVFHDTPWARKEERAIFKKLSYRPERAHKREKRLTEGWEEAGYTITETTSGKKQPVQSTDLEYAQRAQTMAAQAGRLFDDENVPAPAQKASQKRNSSAEPGLLAEWWPQVLVALIGLAIAGVVIKALILS